MQHSVYKVPKYGGGTRDENPAFLTCNWEFIGWKTARIAGPGFLPLFRILFFLLFQCFNFRFGFLLILLLLFCFEDKNIFFKIRLFVKCRVTHNLCLLETCLMTFCHFVSGCVLELSLSLSLSVPLSVSDSLSLCLYLCISLVDIKHQFAFALPQ